MKPKKKKPAPLPPGFPTTEELASIYGVSRKHVEKIRARVNAPAKAEKPGPSYGYHTVKIKKGTLGEISKIREELEELEDAAKQGVKVLQICELCDLIGAIRAFSLAKFNLKLGDLHDMAKLTRKAFEQGYR